MGRTSDFAPATLKVDFKNNNSAKLIARATERATDGSIAKLQKKYEQFQTLSQVYVDGDKIFSYIGKKEGLKGGEKFEVLKATMDQATGKITYKAAGSITVEKDKVWDNRAGAGEKIEGAAKSEDDETTGEKLEYTVFKGNAKKIEAGSFIRQVK